LSGYRALLPLVALLYLLAWLFATRWRRLADRELEAAGSGATKPTELTEPTPVLEGSG
jgi:hypothetical protein